MVTVILAQKNRCPEFRCCKLSNEKKDPLVVIWYIQGMKNYPVMWALFHKPLIIKIPIKQPGFYGKYEGFQTLTEEVVVSPWLFRVSGEPRKKPLLLAIILVV